MAATLADAPVLAPGDRVVAAKALRDVPEGTEGSVAIVTGLTWIRYWVRWDNGVSLGQINRKAIMTPDEWERRHEIAEAAESTGDGDPAAGEGDEAGGDGASVNGVVVPQKLIDRSVAARARLAG